RSAGRISCPRRRADRTERKTSISPVLSVDAIVHPLASPFNARKPDVNDGRRQPQGACRPRQGAALARRGNLVCERLLSARRNRLNAGVANWRQSAGSRAGPTPQEAPRSRVLGTIFALQVE